MSRLLISVKDAQACHAGSQLQPPCQARSASSVQCLAILHRISMTLSDVAHMLNFTACLRCNATYGKSVPACKEIQLPSRTGTEYRMGGVASFMACVRVLSAICRGPDSIEIRPEAIAVPTLFDGSLLTGNLFHGARADLMHKWRLFMSSWPHPGESRSSPGGRRQC